MVQQPRLSAGVVVVRSDRGRWRFLMLRAYRYWDFPKGIVEEGEEPAEAAVRETAEETGIRELKFRWGSVHFTTEPYNQRRKIAQYFLAETDDDQVVLAVSPEMGRPEHDEYRWATLTDALQLARPRIKAVLLWAHGVMSKAA